MKRLITYIACALLAVIAGCSKEVLPESDLAMSFSASDAGVTKAVSPVQPDGSSWLIAEGNTFGVYGTIVNAGADNVQVFEKQVVTCTAGLEWIYSPVKYWKRSGNYNFKAVYPYSAECLSGTDGQRLLVGLHTIPVERAIVEGLDYMRSSVILVEPYSGSGGEMDSGHILGLSPKVPIDFMGKDRQALIDGLAKRPAKRP